LSACAFCGRSNTPHSLYCIDCGKTLDAAAPAAPGVVSARPPHHHRPSPGIGRRASSAAPKLDLSVTVSCAWCGGSIDAGLPFCAHCGRRTDATLAAHDGSEPLPFSTKQPDARVRLAVLDERGEPKRTVPMDTPELTVGRGSSDLSFDEDQYISPLHARFVLRDGTLHVRDLGSCNRSWVFIDAPYTLADNDVLLVGSQILEFQRLGSPAAPGADADGTRRVGSLTPAPDVARLTQLRADGSVRNAQYLALGRTIVIGRDAGDWTFPYDQSMSGRHAELREADGEFVVHDLGSRNGVAVAVRGERALKIGQRILLGDQVLRVESA
jgi:FHA domain/Double zinc ribbon